MNGYIRALLTIPYGYIKLTTIKIIHIKNFKFGCIPRVSINTEISLEKEGKLSIGKRVNIRGSARIRVRKGGNCTIGDRVYINVNAMIVCHENIDIGNDVQFGPNVQIYDHDHDFRVIGGIKAGVYKTAPVKIGDNCWIGCNTIILRGTQIGKNCIVGAGCVLKGNYPDNSIITQKRETNIRRENG